MSTIRIEKYTDKSIVVRGETTEYKETLKSLGGKWNSRLADKQTEEKFGGWIFPLSKIKDVEKWMRNKSVGQQSSSMSVTSTSSNRISNMENMLVEVIKELGKLDKSFIEKINHTEFYKTFLDNSKGNVSDFEVEDSDEEVEPRRRLLSKNIE
tara:strand:+ start:286 stop:744 length:459 start_codon:yes stop_codon:yes gene_type:complete